MCEKGAVVLHVCDKGVVVSRVFERGLEGCVLSQEGRMIQKATKRVSEWWGMINSSSKQEEWYIRARART